MVVHYNYSSSVAELIHLFHILLEGTLGYKIKEKKDYALYFILHCREMQLVDVQFLNKWSRTLECLIKSSYIFVWCPSKYWAFLRYPINISTPLVIWDVKHFLIFLKNYGLLPEGSHFKCLFSPFAGIVINRKVVKKKVELIPGK